MCKMGFESSKSVLVTGASSGIGKAIVVYLAKQGYTVLAGVRKDADAQALYNL
jgi:NAD(P)-dependent dehydrogenase (short-subunit alcohol dehydrogenase family)